MFGFNRKKRAQEHAEAESWAELLHDVNTLEQRVEKLELDNADRQLAVMKSVEKVLHQLRAREAKRQEAAGDTIEEEGPLGYPPPREVAPTANLARRFRGF